MIKPENQFFIFGLGHREKHLYKDGALINIRTNEIVYKWNVEREKFLFDRFKLIYNVVSAKVFEALALYGKSRYTVLYHNYGWAGKAVVV